MSQSSRPPPLTPQFCFNERALRDFLRLSRSSIDDSISTHLNALLTPSTTNPLDPRTISLPNQPHTSGHAVPAAACTSFKAQVLFPAWSTRSRVLEYCTGVATSPDPDDPTLALRQLETEADKNRVVDERLDPYSARFLPREARTERLAAVLRMEAGVERIVRRRTWEIVGERCEEEEQGGAGSSAGSASGRETEGWEVALEKWRKENGEGPRRVRR